MSWNTDISMPLLLRPTGKDYLWGGKRLNDEFAKNIDISPLAETWECSTHPDGLSYVAMGEMAGMSLAEVLTEHPEYLGSHPVSGVNGCLPVMIKFIDANRDLSVQVHPSDEYAYINENGQPGKTEMWYVLDAAKDAHIIYGLTADLTKEDLRKSIEERCISKYLQKIPVKKNDVFFLEPGMIHAIGAGVLVAEIQQNSNLTYRLYDYDRVDKNGYKRELHIDKALEVAYLKSSAEPKQPLRVLKYKPGVASEMLGRCKYFEVHRRIINTERRQEVWFHSDSLSFRVLLCVNGCGTLSFAGETLFVHKGDCIFVPAASVDIRVHGKMQILDVRG